MKHFSSGALVTGIDRAGELKALIQWRVESLIIECSGPWLALCPGNCGPRDTAFDRVLPSRLALVALHNYRPGDLLIPMCDISVRQAQENETALLFMKFALLYSGLHTTP
ncbi:hypothetical protein [Salinisphaera hydrothermalis]|uniref:hypothetical protein n=1 Tax=Salinisphaera hydrothermalis TaxID=563188 RepID=UPI0033410D39